MNWCRWAGALLALAVMAGHAAPDATPEALEYQVKAGYLFNFAKFVEWPARTNDVAAPLVIGIVDDGEVFPLMAATLAGKTIQGRIVETRGLKPGGDLKQCDLLFVARSQRDHVGAVLKAVGTAPVLTVGESEKFAEQGGCIGFVLKGQNVRFEVNLAVAEQAGLKISSKLAAMATAIHRPGKKE